MTPVYVALIVVVPLVALQIIYLAGWRDHWFVDGGDGSDVKRKKRTRAKRK